MSKPWDHLSSEVLIVAGIEAALHVTWLFFAKPPQTLAENISELDCDFNSISFGGLSGEYFYLQAKWTIPNHNTLAI